MDWAAVVACCCLLPPHGGRLPDALKLAPTPSKQPTHTHPLPFSSYRPVACARCARTFEAAPGGEYLDLTLASGAPGARAFSPRVAQSTALFQQPLISFVYERGWRQNFAGAGFPGPEREFEIAMRYFRPVLDNGGSNGDHNSGSGDSSSSGSGSSSSSAGPMLVDASCGTGLFTRLFARSGRFGGGVVALDFSESMLRQARQFFRDDPALRAAAGEGGAAGNGGASGSGGAGAAAAPILCVRADIARLPFATGSVDAIHAGAAIHCWPDPQAALAEVSRVLKPGGVFVASTFLTPFAPLGEIVGDEALRPLSQVGCFAFDFVGGGCEEGCMEGKGGRGRGSWEGGKRSGASCCSRCSCLPLLLRLVPSLPTAVFSLPCCPPAPRDLSRTARRVARALRGSGPPSDRAAVAALAVPPVGGGRAARRRRRRRAAVGRLRAARPLHPVRRREAEAGGGGVRRGCGLAAATA